MKAKTYDFNDYTLTIAKTGKRDMYNEKYQVSYALYNPDNTILFSGREYYPSPLHSPTGFLAAAALMNFLTLCPGDTDDDHFYNYTEAQMIFCTSGDAEGIRWDLPE